MEQELTKTRLNETLNLLGRQECFLEGVLEINTVNESYFEAKLKDVKLIIKGKNLHINKLDLSKEYVQLSGEVTEIKYVPKTLAKLNRLFGK